MSDMAPTPDMAAMPDMEPAVDMGTDMMSMPDGGGDLCGNGQLDPGELCEGASCPTMVSQCGDDGDMCTETVLTGSAAACTAACVDQPITLCMGGDGCCPGRCDASNDSDCGAMSCGNGMLDVGEQCDPQIAAGLAGACPLSCGDGDVCTSDALMGSVATCDATCQSAPITNCTPGDGCCPAGCMAPADTDCTLQPNDLCGFAVPAGVWGPASVIDTFTFPDPATTPCCRDFDGDGTEDNALGNLVSALAGIGSDPNAAIAASIASGDLALVLEYDGLTTLTPPVGGLTLGSMSGEPQCFAAPDPAGGNVYKIRPSSLLTNTTIPRYTMRGGQIAASNALTAGPGVAEIPFFGLGLSLPLRHARLEANVVPPASGLPTTGVALNQGELSGVLGLADAYDAINTFTQTSCTCLSPNNRPLVINYTPSSVVNASCDSAISASACDPLRGEQACIELVDNLCPYLPILASFADRIVADPSVDCQADSNLDCDALSVGATFTAVGARISGTTTP